MIDPFDVQAFAKRVAEAKIKRDVQLRESRRARQMIRIAVEEFLNNRSVA